MPNTESLHFITSAGIKNIVGKDLITDRFVAIFELVKNSYDARANKVVVSFDMLNEVSSITIRDNGVGMNKDDLEKKWLHLAYSEKKEGQTNNGRASVGSKGIGRFSCDSLGSLLTIRTKKENESIENILKVNWLDFEKSLEERFEKIKVKYSSENVEKSKLASSYTVLQIDNLHHQWTDDAIQKAAENLRRLKNPFNPVDGFDIYCGSNIVTNYKNFNQIPENYLIKSNISEILKDKSITIEVKIDKLIKVNLFDRGKHIYTLQKKNDTILTDCDVFISINYLTTSAKMTFTRRMGIEAVNYGNVYIYRNDFRVSPYGDRDYDLFGINIRKSQGHSRYIGTRELIGYIDIKDTNNIFKETSSRNNGFIENAYLDTLKDIYLEYTHKPLERYVHLVNWGENNDTHEKISLDSVAQNETQKFVKGLTSKVFGEFSLISFDKNLSFDENNPKKQLEKIVATLPPEQQVKANTVVKQLSNLIKDKHEKEYVIQKNFQTIVSLELQNKNISNRRPESSFGEQLSHHFPAMADRLNVGVKELHALGLVLSDSQNKKFFEALRKIRRTELELRSFKNLLLNTNLDLRAPHLINWYELASQFIDDKHSSISHGILKLNCPPPDDATAKVWNIRSNAIEVMMMFENFYRNAEEHGAKFLEIIFDTHRLVISSDSEPIADENINKIFELGFSTKSSGTGIGLNQISEFLKRVKLEIKAVNLPKKVSFIITKKVS